VVARVDEELQRDFSLHQTLALYLVDAVAALDPESEDYALDVVSLVEAVLEDPRPLLLAQVRVVKDRLVAELKAERVPYEERMAKLEGVTWPRPLADFLRATFDLFAERHPWAARLEVRPKSIAREMLEGWIGFDEYVRRYRLQRVEGLLLRYLSQVHGTLARSVPETARSDELVDAIAHLRALIARVDSSLVEEWESLVHPGEPEAAAGAPPPLRRAVRLDRRGFEARVRAELHQLVGALATGDWEEASACVAQDPDDPWPPERFEAALAPFLEQHGRLRFDPAARRPHLTLLRERERDRFEVHQTLLDPDEEGLWEVEGEIALEDGHLPEGPMVRVLRIGT